MPYSYEINNLPIQLTDAEVRAFCDSQGVLLAQGPEIGNNFVRIVTVEPILNKPALHEAIHLALHEAIGKITEL